MRWVHGVFLREQIDLPGLRRWDWQPLFAVMASGEPALP